MSEAK
jgi:hypothetical protein